MPRPNVRNQPDLLAAAESLRWARPDLTAELADHVLAAAATAGDPDRWLAAAGWAVHSRSATGDGRVVASEVLDELAQWEGSPLANPEARRLCVELASLAVSVGEVDSARSLVLPVIAEASWPALRAAACCVLARCAAEDGVSEVEEALHLAESAWSEIGGGRAEIGAAEVALVAAVIERRAGRPAVAAARAAEGLDRLDDGRGASTVSAPSAHLAAALAAEWISALIDAGRPDEASDGCVPLAPRLSEGNRPSRQLALLRLTVARIVATGSDRREVADSLARAAWEAAESDTPDLEAVCRSALGALHESAGRLDDALDAAGLGVAARRLDEDRSERFVTALRILVGSTAHSRDSTMEYLTRGASPVDTTARSAVAGPPPGDRSNGRTRSAGVAGVGRRNGHDASFIADPKGAGQRHSSAPQDTDHHGRLRRVEHPIPDGAGLSHGLGRHDRWSVGDPLRPHGHGDPDRSAHSENGAGGRPTRNGDAISRRSFPDTDSLFGPAASRTGSSDESPFANGFAASGREPHPDDAPAAGDHGFASGGYGWDNPAAVTPWLAGAEVGGEPPRRRPVDPRLSTPHNGWAQTDSDSPIGDMVARDLVATDQSGRVEPATPGNDRPEVRSPWSTGRWSTDQRPADSDANRLASHLADRDAVPPSGAEFRTRASRTAVLGADRQPADLAGRWSTRTPNSRNPVGNTFDSHTSDGHTSDGHTSDRRSPDEWIPGSPDPASQDPDTPNLDVRVGDVRAVDTRVSGFSRSEGRAAATAETGRTDHRSTSTAHGTARGTVVPAGSAALDTETWLANALADLDRALERSVLGLSAAGPADLGGSVDRASGERGSRDRGSDDRTAGRADVRSVGSRRPRGIESGDIDPAGVGSRVNGSRGVGSVGSGSQGLGSLASEPETADESRAGGRRPPDAEALGCVVVIDIARDGRRFAGPRAGAVIRAVAERLVDRLPDGSRLRYEGADALSVVLPGWGRIPATEWMYRTLPGLLEGLTVAHELPATQLRAAVHDADGSVGAQLLQRIDLAGPRREVSPQAPLTRAGSGTGSRAASMTVNGGRSRPDERTPFHFDPLDVEPGSGGRRHRQAPSGPDAADTPTPNVFTRPVPSAGAPRGGAAGDGSSSGHAPVGERSGGGTRAVEPSDAGTGTSPNRPTSTEGLGLADLLAGALAAYRGI